MKRIIEVLERVRGWSFQAQHMGGVKNILADGKEEVEEE